MNRSAVELDRKLTAVFKALLKGPLDGAKGDKARKDFGAVRERVIDAVFGKRLEGLFDDFSRPAAQRRQREAEESLVCVRELRDRGFVETAALLFIAWREVVGGLSLERVLTTAPNAACLDSWMKAAKMPAQEVEKHLLAEPAATYATAGADWSLARTKPEQLLPLLELFLTRQARPAFLHPWNEALVAALKKDKRGALLGATLRHPWPAEDRIAALADAVRSNRSLLRITVDLLPAILAQKDASPAGAGFVGEIFRAVVTTEGAEREFVTAALARLGTGVLMADRRGPQADAALEVVRKAARQLRNLTKDETLQARTWALENLRREDEPTDGQLHVTTEGARHLALALEKAEQGFAAKDILTVTARNLGLSLIGKAGEVVSFDPLQHDDVQGGLVPGDSVVIEEAGLAIRQEPLIRAKVKRAQGGSHV
jgi:hypothetical protein